MASPQYKFSERLAIFFTIEGACLSIVSATFILCFSGYRWMRSKLLELRGHSGLARPFDATDSSLFINLMVADLIQALGILPNIMWMNQGFITEGSTCKAQAVLKQVGIVGVSLTSLAIALHTFCILVLKWKSRPHFSKFVVIGVWVATGLIIGIGNAGKRHKRYYGITGYWCWIVDDFEVERIVTEYLWVWLAGASMIILYGIMYMVIRGWFTIGQPGNARLEPPETEDDRRTKAIANLMLFYPAVYMFCVFPNTISRWLSFSRSRVVPYQFTLFANTLFSLSGMCNLILFFVTRPDVVVGRRIIAPIPGPSLMNSDDGQNTSINPPGSISLGYLPNRWRAEPMAQQSHSEFSPWDLYNAPSLVKQASAGSRLTGTSMQPEWNGTHLTRYSGPSFPGTVDQDQDSGRLPS